MHNKTVTVVQSFLEVVLINKNERRNFRGMVDYMKQNMELRHYFTVA